MSTCSECGTEVYRDLESATLPLPIRNASDNQLHSCTPSRPMAEVSFLELAKIWPELTDVQQVELVLTAVAMTERSA